MAFENQKRKESGRVPFISNIFNRKPLFWACKELSDQLIRVRVEKVVHLFNKKKLEMARGISNQFHLFFHFETCMIREKSF